jgi:hypothetical protein
VTMFSNPDASPFTERCPLSSTLMRSGSITKPRLPQLAGTRRRISAEIWLSRAKSAYARSRNRGHTLSPLQSGGTGRKCLSVGIDAPPGRQTQVPARTAGRDHSRSGQPGAEQRGHTRADRYKVPDFALQTAIRGLTSASCAHQLRKSGRRALSL